MDWVKYLRLLNVTSISLLVCILLSCGNLSKSQQYNSVEDEEEYYNNEDNENNGIEDGTYSADVDYYNPDTGYSASYTLDVEVQDGCVTTIYFPNDGYLDDSHFDATELDDDGNCVIYDDEGREFSIHIDY